MNTAIKFVGALCLVAVVSGCGEGADGEWIGASESVAVASSTVTSSADVTSVEETSSEAEPTTSEVVGPESPVETQPADAEETTDAGSGPAAPPVMPNMAPR